MKVAWHSRKLPKLGNMGNMDVRAQTLLVSQGLPAGEEGSADDTRPVVRSQGMDGLQAFLEEVRQHGLAVGNLLGLLHILIGRRITRTDGTLISPGQTWREV